jgi:predicted amidohydrolase YtcJ
MPRDLWAAMRAAVDPSLFGEEADHPAQALSAVSFDAARLVSADGERGSVRPGKSADFFLVAEDPLLQDFARSLSSAMTVRAGQVTHFHEGSS